MANGVAIGRPATPPIIRITIPESDVYEHPRGVTSKVVQEEKTEGVNKNIDGVNNLNDDDKQTTTTTEKNEDSTDGGFNVPLSNKHRKNSISLPAALDNLDIQKYMTE
ncbi:hypothetical protein Phum_PHUM048760 [Pediculus humanus corporis]|uniref:Uncharacterized protein n=1 Tax=Pediculus humanus subsp. corporis TaxID=121224 RepID=E0VB11_PEDHC|nr:uncharacterized protein Phum_PHUM048760 [Pediculus humanus corporis]EEB10567.1 hypothetical protein Phum_PHUM048760 [Pediculus humanus corporis]